MSLFIDAIVGLWNVFYYWIGILFIMPFYNLDMLWILVPVWLSWLFSEFYQEKAGTNFGNAVSNSIVVLWAGIDSIRVTMQFIDNGTLTRGQMIESFGICAFMILYGVMIIWFGTHLNKKVKYFGRIRDVTYVFLMLIPITYGVLPLTWTHIITAIVFFPLFYYIMEFIDYITPDPKVITADAMDAISVKNEPLTNTPLKQQVNISQQTQNYQQNTPTNQEPSQSNISNYWNNDE